MRWSSESIEKLLNALGFGYERDDLESRLAVTGEHVDVVGAAEERGPVERHRRRLDATVRLSSTQVGTQLRPFPKSVLDACYRAAQERYAEENAKNPKWKKIYDNYMAFQREQVLWFRVCENTYDNYMATAGATPAAPAKKS